MRGCQVSARLKLLSAIVVAGIILSLCGYNSINARAQAKRAEMAYGQIDLKRLLAADEHPEEWLTAGRDVGKGHYSPLTQINRKTVARLGFAWGYDTHTNRGLEATPIVVGGVMYTSGSGGTAYALDARTGRELWTFDPKNDLSVTRRSCCDIVNRGVAVWKGKVYVASFDGRLFALDAATGTVLWQADTIIDHKRGGPRRRDRERRRRIRHARLPQRIRLGNRKAGLALFYRSRRSFEAI